MTKEATVGIESMGVGYTRHYLPLLALAEARGIEPAKYEKGLGCLNMAVPQTTEDTVTLAASAAEAALRNGNISPEEIGLLIVGTETAVDHAKPVASYVQGLLGISSSCRVYEIKHACYGATAGILTAAQWVASGANRGKKALVIASDIARYGVRTAGEPTQGAGAAAMVVSATPRILALDYARTGAWSRDVHDFWRPLSSPDALVDGAFSLECYLEALRESFKQYAAGEDLRTVEESFHSLLLHVPFVKMTDKGHKALLAMTRDPVTDEAVAASYQARVRPSLRIAEQIGNAYTASLWLALASAIESGSYKAGAKIGFYSYGSGFCGEFFAGTLLTTGPGSIGAFGEIDQRKAIDVATYERWMAARLQPQELQVPEAPTRSPFAFLGVRENKRIYERVAAAV
jgi:hydroxymethylglutaryl-CoA synthase